MASSAGSMEDKAFSERVKKTFGSLFASLEPSPASLSNPLWSLTGGQVEKKEWRRDKDTSDRDNNPCSSSFDEFLSQARKNSRKNIKNYDKELQDNLQDLNDDDDVDDEEEGGEGEKDDINDWDVKSSIGLDSTLDNEEEEDTFDKVATGRENAGDRLYMSDVMDDHDSHFISKDDLPGAVEIRERDPRANRWAALIRLKEDDAEAAAQTEQPKPGQSSTSEKYSAMSAEGLDKLKPILKRKEHESTSKPSKRVRFDPLFVSNGDRTGEVPSKNTSAETNNQGNGSVLGEKVSRVPDYVQNPSNYTRYSLESTDEISNTSNTDAYMDFVEMVKKEKNSGSGSESDVPADLPTSIAFVPKKKSDTSKGVHTEVSQGKGSDAKHPTLQATFLDVAAEEQETEVGDMEVDEPKTSAEPDKDILFKKKGRQYRTKPQGDEPA